MFIKGQIVKNNRELVYKNGQVSCKIPIGTKLKIRTIGLVGDNEDICVTLEECPHIMWNIEHDEKIIFD